MRVVDRYFPHPSRFDDLDDPPADRFSPPAGMRAEEVLAEQHGNVTEVDHRRLLDWAVEHDAIVEVVPPVGEFVVEGATAMRVWRDAGADELDDAERRALRAAVVVEQDRRFTQDPAFGIRKLVDIAERALSSGINDPTTAVQVLDELHRVLRTLVQQQDLPHSVPHEGVVRLVHRPQRVDELIDLALEEVLHYAGGTLQVPRKVIAMLQDAGAVARDEHRERLRHWERIAGELVAETSKRDAAGA